VAEHPSLNQLSEKVNAEVRNRGLRPAYDAEESIWVSALGQEQL
jgi:hypothetical protein